jgi:hypothetical protein
MTQVREKSLELTRACLLTYLKLLAFVGSTDVGSVIPIWLHWRVLAKGSVVLTRGRNYQYAFTVEFQRDPSVVLTPCRKYRGIPVLHSNG